jgi:hypothetical protein
MNHQIIIKYRYCKRSRRYWSDEDYSVIGKFNFSDAETAEKEFTRVVEMAISDYEPNEAAEILLAYKLGEELNEGQIEQISHNMLIDKVCEEYPEIHMQARLFHVNQLLYKAYNGKFPNKASVVHFSMI